MANVAAALGNALKRAQTVLLLEAIVCFSIIIGCSFGIATEQVTINAGINLVWVVGLYIFVGNSGLFSFGQMAFAAIGAYTAGLISIPQGTKAALLPQLPTFLMNAHVSPVVATLIGGTAAALVAAVLAVPTMRLSGLTASLGTFLILQIVYVIASNWETVTSGSEGIGGVPITTTRNVILVWCVLSVLAAYLFQRTSLALRLKATREDEIAARAGGVGVFKERSAAWVLSAFVSGIGGALFGAYVGTFDPMSFYLSATFTIVAMLVIGGFRSLSGAVIGCVFISIVADGLQRVEQGFSIGSLHVSVPPGLQELGIAIIMLTTLIVRPSGLIGDRELTITTTRERRPAQRDAARAQA